MELQAKLLRFLQERVVERIGGRKLIPGDVRILCATHQNLQDLIAKGLFREDLFYRISDMVLDIPPLKQREGDILVLAKSFLAQWSREYKTSPLDFSPQAIAAMEAYDWPGNVRELESRVKRGIILAEGGQISADDLELGGTIIPMTAAMGPSLQTLKAAREEAERSAVIRAMGASNQNISDAANVLGITRPTLYTLLEKLGIKIGA
jgi:two-component system NtrC family response regulator